MLVLTSFIILFVLINVISHVLLTLQIKLNSCVVFLWQVFVNFAKKQSDNLEQQESSPPGGGQSPLQRLLNILRPQTANTELNALVCEEPEELESDDDEGLISFEEERVRQGLMREKRMGIKNTSEGGAGTVERVSRAMALQMVNQQ